MRRMFGVGVALALFAAVAGCGGDGADTSNERVEQAGSSHFVGEIAELDAFIGVVVRTDGSMMAYVCDGGELGMWATGRVDGGGADLTATVGSGGVRVELDDEREATGTVTLPDGREASFAATRASGDAGLYRRLTASAAASTDAPELTGWVVLADGRTKGSGPGASSQPTPVDKVSQLTIVQQCPRTLPESLFPEELIKTFGLPRYNRAAVCGIPAGRRGPRPAPVVDVSLANAELEEVVDEIEAAIGKQIADCLARRNAPERPLLATKGYGDLKRIFNQLTADSRFLIASSNLYSRITEAKDADAIAKAEAGFRSLIPAETVRLIDAVSAELQKTAQGVDIGECLAPEPTPAPDLFPIPRDTMSWEGSGEAVGEATYSAEAGEAGDGSFLMSARVDVGASSSATASVMLLAPFEVPERVKGVTITVRGGGSGNGIPTSMLGVTCDSQYILLNVYDAEDHVNDAAAGSSGSDCHHFLPVPTPSGAPVPDPGLLLPSHYVLEFEPDHAGKYFVAIYVRATADAGLFASIFAEMYYFLEEIEVAFERN